MAEIAAGGQLRNRVYAVVEGGRRGYPAGRVFDAVLVLVILLNLAAIVLGTLPTLPARLVALFADLEALIVSVFTIEYLLRLWVCVEDGRRRYRHPMWGRLRWMASPLAIIDVLTIAPFYLSLLFDFDPTLAGIVRMLRLVKLLRYTGAFETITTVIANERRSLFAAACIVAMVLLVISTLAYLAEREAQPDRFGSIPDAMWWGLVTLSTVGYGDLTPITPLGRIIGGAAVVLGVASFALPAGILASGFAEEMKRRTFVVSWNLVSKVPLFQRLSAARIATVVAELKVELAEAGQVVIRKGDPAEGMYFIAAGELEVETPRGPAMLCQGDFFGEMALLEGGVRRATVTARTRSQLFVLDAAAFQRLREDNPEIEAGIRRIMDQRIAQDAQAPPSTPA